MLAVLEVGGSLLGADRASRISPCPASPSPCSAATGPGIVAAVTCVLADAGCNLEDTSMPVLRGHFAICW
jgi:hypothetical protein